MSHGSFSIILSTLYYPNEIILNPLYISIATESVRFEFVFTSLCSSLVLRGKLANSVLGLVW